MQLIPPNPAQLIARGKDAARLLSETVFMDAVNDLSSTHIAAIVAAPPGEPGREAREYHHLMHYALAEIVGALGGYAVAGNEMDQLVQLTEEIPDDID